MSTLALGTAAVATVFTLTNTLFFRQLNVDRPDRIVVVEPTREHGRFPGWASYPDYVHFRDNSNTLEGLAAAYSTAPLFVSVNGRSQEINGAVVSANFFPLLRIRPAAGRFFRSDEDAVPNRNPVAIISFDFWRDWLDKVQPRHRFPVEDQRRFVYGGWHRPASVSGGHDKAGRNLHSNHDGKRRISLLSELAWK
jgi:hypothetical protein